MPRGKEYYNSQRGGGNQLELIKNQTHGGIHLGSKSFSKLVWAHQDPGTLKIKTDMTPRGLQVHRRAQGKVK